jgi:hypothetical protein
VCIQSEVKVTTGLFCEDGYVEIFWNEKEVRSEINKPDLHTKTTSFLWFDKYINSVDNMFTFTLLSMNVLDFTL